MVVRYRGPRSELRGATGILDIRNGKLVFQRPDGLKLMEIPISVVYASRVRCGRRGWLRRGYKLEVPELIFNPKTKQVYVAFKGKPHEFEDSKKELEDVRDRLLGLKSKWEEWACEEVSKLVDELDEQLKELTSSMKLLLDKLKEETRIEVRAVDDIENLMKIEKAAQEREMRTWQLLALIEYAKVIERNSLERKLKELSRELARIREGLRGVCEKIRGCIYTEHQKLKELFETIRHEKFSPRIIEFLRAAEELKDTITRAKKIWPELSSIEKDAEMMIEEISIPPAWEVLLTLERHAAEQARKWGRLTATEFIKQEPLPLPVFIYGGTKIIETVTFPWSVINHFLLQDTGKRAGIMLIDAERQLKEFIEREAGLRRMKEDVDVYTYVGYDSSVLVRVRASQAGIGIMLYMLPSEFIPRMFRRDTGNLSLLMRYCDVGEDIQAIICSNGGTGKGLMLLAEKFFGDRFISDGFRTRLIWWIGPKDAYLHDPKQLWDVPLVLAFHAFANTGLMDRKMIDIVGEIETISKLPALIPGVVLSTIPLLDYLTRINFLSSLWGSSPWKYDLGDAKRDLEDVAQSHDVNVVFSLTNGKLLEGWDEMLRLLSEGRGTDATNILTQPCVSLVERALKTLGFEPKRDLASLIIVLICLPGACEDITVLHDVHDILRETLEAYVREGGRLSLGLFIGNMPPCVIVRVFPDQREVVKQSVRWLMKGSRDPVEFADALKRHINRSIEALRGWRGIDPSYVNEIIRAWEKLRDEVLPEIVSEIQSGGG